jgi:hypothetical protein
MFKSIPTAALLVLVAGFLILFIGGGARLAIGLTLRPMIEDLAWDRNDIGLAVGVFQVVSAICTFYAGRLADRMSLRVVLGSGLVIASAGMGLMSLVQSPWQALALYGIIFAIGNGATSSAPVGVMVTRAFPHRAGLANSLALAGMSVGQFTRPHLPRLFTGQMFGRRQHDTGQTARGELVVLRLLKVFDVLGDRRRGGLRANHRARGRDLSDGRRSGDGRRGRRWLAAHFARPAALFAGSRLRRG